METGAYESICVGGGAHFFAPPLGNIVTPPLKNPFFEKNWYLF